MSEFYFTGGVPWWAFVAIALAASALLLHQFLSFRRRLGAPKGLLLILLRGLVYALLVFFLLSPGLVERRVSRLRHPLTLVIDTSQSMALPAAIDPGEEGKPSKSRIDFVKEKLLNGKEPLIQKLARDYNLQIYHLDTGMTAVGPAAISQLAAQGRGTRLLEGLRQIGEDPSSAGIILFSDGITNGEIKSVDDLPSLRIPVFAVGVADSGKYADLRITDLRAPEFAFRGREVKLDMTVQAYGLAGKTVPLYFNRGKNLISSRSITIDRDPFEQRVTLSYIPREIGSHSFTLAVPAQAGEAILQNNHKEFKIDVQRDKLRVLTLSGSPSWNYRFLRMALKQDPFIDLVSFVFLRTPTDSVDVPDNQLSLIPFPIDEIFLEEIKNFDIVVFDDFSYRSYFNIIYLEKVREFVRDGGGFAMLGGSRSFDRGGYAESSLRDLLPVELDGKGSYQNGVQVRGLLTTAGKAHPVTRLFSDPAVNEATWKRMPPLTTLNQVLRARGEALLLATTDGAGTGYPLLTVGRFGKGRTLALMSDDFWRWNLVAVGQRESPQNHLKLVRQAVRWLAQEPSFEQVQIQPLAGSKAPGEKIIFTVKVLKDDFTPAARATLRVRISGPEDESTMLDSMEETEEGIYAGEFTPSREGAYRLEADATLSGKLLGKDSKSFVAAHTFGEAEDGRPRPDLLKQIADKSRGDFISISDWDEKSLERMAAKLDSLKPAEIVERRQIQLWSTLWTFLPILLLLSSEWWMRRKWGLI
ncbi:MAG: hypothetical protein HY695_12775 [Deltaproteobacteria bacterium]|nr:hypothetical protein [Deltaproteobacteria bacterium]